MVKTTPSGCRCCSPTPPTKPHRLPTLFFLFSSREKSDEENKKNRAGSQQVVVPVGWLALAAVAVAHRCLLLPACPGSVGLLACGWVSSAVRSSSSAVVGAVRPSLAPHHRSLSPVAARRRSSARLVGLQPRRLQPPRHSFSLRFLLLNFWALLRRFHSCFF
jgi:hypothetical protein